MAGTVQDIQNDIAFMKSLASEGGRVPAQAGAHLFAAGLIYGVCLVIAWAGLEGYIEMSRGTAGAVALWATVIYLPVMLWLFWRGRKTRLGGTAARAFVAAWGGIGLSSLTIVISLVVVGRAVHQTHLLSMAWPPVAFALYGGAWMGLTIARGKGAWWLVALGSYATAIGVAGLTGSNHEWLLFGVGLLAFVAAPGALLMWRARTQA